MVRVKKDLSDFFTDGTSTGLSGDQTGNSLLGEVPFQTPNLSGLSTPFYSLKRNKERQPSLLSRSTHAFTPKWRFGTQACPVLHPLTPRLTHLLQRTDMDMPPSKASEGDFIRNGFVSEDFTLSESLF
jgi:hypothetical protein